MVKQLIQTLLPLKVLTFSFGLNPCLKLMSNLLDINPQIIEKTSLISLFAIKAALS
jgi:hypothetical protein